MADGGEGTLDILLHALNGSKVETFAEDPLGREIPTYFGIIGTTAVIEMATVSGLAKLLPEERNPLYASTYGLGELICQAASTPYIKEIIVTVGGSATNDGGLGMAQALGMRALDGQGRELTLGGRYLGNLAQLDKSRMHRRLKEINFIVATDVDNLLCGINGASAVYGPQKGATPQMVEELDQNLFHLAGVVMRDLGVEILNLPCGGAAGGTGAGLVAFCGAVLKNGIDTVLDILDFDKYLQDADLVFTGEGRTDFQTAFGKAPLGVARRAKKYGKPVVCLSGALGQGYKELYQVGIDAMFSISPGPLDELESMAHSYELLVDAAEDILRLYKISMEYLG